MQAIRNFTVIAKREREENQDLLSRMRERIESLGGKLNVLYWAPKGQPDELLIPEGTDVILTLGGDGTLVRAASRTYENAIPLLGVNRGHLGYLCDFDSDTVFDAIERLMKGDYDLEERMVLSGHVERKDGSAVLAGIGSLGKAAGSDTGTADVAALNDIVITSENGRKVICLTIFVNGERLYTFNGDGVIFATPTGSTAYNMSASGPIVDPKAELILMTPINPHTLNTRSMILDPADQVEVVIERRRTSTENIAVSFDGRPPVLIGPEDKVVVKRAAKKIRIVRLSRMNFLERIRKKMQDNY